MGSRHVGDENAIKFLAECSRDGGHFLEVWGLQAHG